jgi:hypothetical protein
MLACALIFMPAADNGGRHAIARIFIFSAIDSHTFDHM